MKFYAQFEITEINVALLKTKITKFICAHSRRSTSNAKCVILIINRTTLF